MTICRVIVLVGLLAYISLVLTLPVGYLHILVLSLLVLAYASTYIILIKLISTTQFVVFAMFEILAL